MLWDYAAIGSEMWIKGFKLPSQDIGVPKKTFVSADLTVHHKSASVISTKSKTISTRTLTSEDDEITERIPATCEIKVSKGEWPS